MEREPGPPLGDERILEGDDPPDQVETGGVHLACRGARVVVRLRGAGGPRERRRAADEADLAVLVLDIQLDRVEAGALEREVLVELAVQARERHRDVYTAHLTR